MRFLVRTLDDLIRKTSRVFEFSREADCLLRLQVGRAPHPLRLPDLTVEAGKPVLLLHLWNERLPPFPPDGVDLAWARPVLHRFQRSLCLAAGYLRDEDQLRQVRAVGGVTILLTSGLHESGSRFLQELGFTVVPSANRLGRFGEFWESFYSWLIIWTFNPGGMPKRSLLRWHRSEIWMSREAFLRRFGERG